jgi:3-phosphoshikimate 1-carboxyvinyltransferase
MADGPSTLHGVLDSEDTQVMVDSWRRLGINIDWDLPSSTIRISGCGGQPPNDEASLFVANSGTSIRFLTATLAATRGHYTLDGVPRMRERPIGDLIHGLHDWGVDIRNLNPVLPNCPPVQLDATGISGGTAKIKGDVSSQFLSGMLLAAPYARSPVCIQVVGELVSKPYVAMTAEVMRSFGVNVRIAEGLSGDAYTVDAPTHYQGCQYAIEPDASAASYFLAAAAMTGGRVRVEGLDRNSLQGDVGFADVLSQMGCTVEFGTGYVEVSGRASVGIDVDMNKISDTVQTLAVVALFALGPTRVRGVAHNRHKETDRIGDLACELRKLGARVDEHKDGLTITPGDVVGCELDTYGDHRMAMSLALAALMVPNVVIRDPRCTEKTYPRFFEDLADLVNQTPRYQI